MHYVNVIARRKKWILVKWKQSLSLYTLFGESVIFCLLTVNLKNQRTLILLWFWAMIFSLGNWYSEKGNFWKISTGEAIATKIRICPQSSLYVKVIAFEFAAMFIVPRISVGFEFSGGHNSKSAYHQTKEFWIFSFML